MIALDGVSKSYATASGRRVVLDNATIAFAAGHNYGILGANGAGKSTLIRLLAGSELPDRGAIIRDVRVSFPLGFGGTFHGALSGRDNVRFLARLYGAGVRAATRFAEEFAELGEYFDMKVATYSAGMRARLAFAACFAIEFDVYLIDEVTEVGDERFQQRCAAAFAERMTRADIIMVTHNSRTIRRYCDRAAVLSQGRLILCDELAGAFARYRAIPAEAQRC